MKINKNKVQLKEYIMKVSIATKAEDKQIISVFITI